MCATSASSSATAEPPKKEDGAQPRDEATGAAFALLLLSNCLETAALALILPAYPGLCKALGIDLRTRGWMISIYSLLQFLMSPLLGRASDVVGRTTMLRISALASVCTYTAMLLAHDPWVFMLGRVLPGVVKCGISVSQAYITDISSQHDRPKNLGILGSMYGLAFVLGPAAGGMLMRRDLWMTVKVALAAAVLNVLVLLLLPEPPGNATGGKGKGKASSQQPQQANGAGAEESVPTTTKKDKPTASPSPSSQSFWGLVRQSGTGRGATVAVLLGRKLCTSFASGLFETTFAEYCARHLGLDGHVLGLLLSYLGVLSLLNNSIIIRFLSERFTNAQLLLPAILGQTTALLMWSYVHDTTTLCLVLAALSVSGGLFQTLLSAELSKATPHELIGSILGVSYAIEVGAKVITPPLSSYLLDHRGPHTLGWASALFLLPCLANVAFDSVRRRGDEHGVEKLEKKVQ